jgi:hypothetical protein
LTFHIKRVKNEIGWEYDAVESDSMLQDLVLFTASVVRGHWKTKRLGQKIIDPYTGQEALDPLTEVSPSFMARIIPRWSPAAWAHAFSAERKKGHLKLIETIGNEKFYRATDIGSNLALNTSRHMHFLLLKINERLRIQALSDGRKPILTKEALAELSELA